MSGTAAFEDAFDDIRRHQMAMLAGVRAAFESLLVHFNPDRFERRPTALERSAFAGKGKYWERYREHFEGLNKDPHDCFRRPSATSSRAPTRNSRTPEIGANAAGNASLAGASLQRWRTDRRQVDGARLLGQTDAGVAFDGFQEGHGCPFSMAFRVPGALRSRVFFHVRRWATAGQRGISRQRGRGNF
ncbi:hypothetical protein RLIN73S_02205 [Rhodanobacter lindaniclasticus]